jgi:hypothetical protein
VQKPPSRVDPPGDLLQPRSKRDEKV